MWQSMTGKLTFTGVVSALKGIKSNYHFLFTADSLGTVFYKMKLDDVEFSFQLCNSAETVQQRLAQMPAEVAPQAYLKLNRSTCGIPSDHLSGVTSRIFCAHDRSDTLQ